VARRRSHGFPGARFRLQGRGVLWLLPGGDSGVFMSGDARSLLRAATGRELSGFSRVRFLKGGVVTTEVGALSLHFTDGTLLTLDSGPDGEVLSVLPRAWQDPFLGSPATPETTAYIAAAGKWEAFDVSGEPEYVGLLGARVLSVLIIETVEGKPVGAIFRTMHGRLNAIVEADDLYVHLPKNAVW
jgi:hypothetical protein